MTRAPIRCTARMMNGYDCRTPARYWVERGLVGIRARGGTGAIEPRCANHARAYSRKWFLRTADPVADRTHAERVN